MKPNDIKTAMLEDAARSGLSAAHVKRLGLRPMDEDETKALTQRKAVAYLIPYYTIDGKERKFARARFLSAVKEKGFGTHKLQRYWQPTNTLPAFYLPPLVKWDVISQDAEKMIMITEGEKKAAKACAEGVPCIGLGGVWSWKSKKAGLPAIDDFGWFKWKGREVLLCFDSDVSTNPKVIAALNALSKELTNRGAMIKVVRLPSESEDTKVGLDDYLMENSKKELLELPREEYAENAEMLRLNEELAYIDDLSSVYSIQHDYLHKNKGSLVSLAFADRNIKVYEGEKVKEVNAADLWLKWPYRRRHKSLVYEPGQGVITDRGGLNTWRGWGCEPDESMDIEPWDDLLDYIFKDDEAFKIWFEKWLAYPLQHPGTKLFSSVLLMSLAQGTGKSFIGYIMGDIYGQNFAVVTQDELNSAFNGWAVHKQLIMGEEITGSDKRRDADRIKNMLTREQILVNIKYQPSYALRDCANFLFTSNHPDAMFLENSDRRIAIHETRGAPKPDSFYARIDKWRKGGGARGVFNKLLEMNLEGFNPKTPAIFTDSKREMIELSKSDLDITSEQIATNPDSLLQMDGIRADRDLFTIDEVLLFVDPEGRRSITKIALSKALRRAGFRCKTVRTTEQGTKKLWALKNRDKWEVRGHHEWVAAYERSVIYLEDKKPDKFKQKKESKS